MLISPEGRGTSHLNCRGESERSQGQTKRFRPEREAKKFARAKLFETSNDSAGKLNPHMPKRTIAPTLMLEWLEENRVKQIWLEPAGSPLHLDDGQTLSGGFPCVGCRLR